MKSLYKVLSLLFLFLLLVWLSCNPFISETNNANNSRTHLDIFDDPDVLKSTVTPAILSSGKPISENVPITGNFTRSSIQYHYYLFEAVKGKTYMITTNSDDRVSHETRIYDPDAANTAMASYHIIQYYEGVSGGKTSYWTCTEGMDVGLSYIRVSQYLDGSGNASGKYTILLTTKPAPEGDEFEEDNDKTQAYLLEVNGTQYHTFDALYDTDLMYFNAKQGEVYTIELSTNERFINQYLLDSQEISDTYLFEPNVPWTCPKTDKFFLVISNSGISEYNWRCSLTTANYTVTLRKK